MRPDAVIIPGLFYRGADFIVGIVAPVEDDAVKESIVEMAEQHLQTGPFELAWCRDQMTYHFCTRSPDDTELFPVWHPRCGQPRYTWEEQNDGIKLGFLR